VIGTCLCVDRVIPNAVVGVLVRISDGPRVHRNGRQISCRVNDRLCRCGVVGRLYVMLGFTRT
jgi:hypothetical protein